MMQFLILQPSNPNRNLREVNKAINLFKNKKIKSLVSVSNAKEHPYKYFRIKRKFLGFLRKKNNKIS